MPDVLSQSEVDQLLAAVGGAAGSAKDREAAGPADVRYYDFLRPERASSTEMRALADLHEAAATNIAAALGGALRTNVDCRLQGFEQVSWGEFAMGMPNPTCFAVALAKPYGARFALEIGPAVMHPMIEHLLGAPSGASGPAVGEPPSRPLTAIERRVAGTLVEMVLEALAGVWSRAASGPSDVAALRGQRRGPDQARHRGRATPVDLTPVQIETNPQIAAVAPPAEMAVMATFELSIGGPGEAPRAGLMHVCMPFSTFGALFGRLAELGERGAGGGAKEAARAALMRVPVRVEAFVAWTRMTLREIAALAPGDVIRTGRSTGDSVILTVAGQPKFASTSGEFRGRRAVRVSGRIEGPPVGLGTGGGSAP